jgi:hypothetical protein
MSIGICVRYRDPAREEEYRPYLTQRHLTDFLCPLAASLGAWRIEFLEFFSSVDDPAEELGELCEQFEAVCRSFNDSASGAEQYPHREHVENRTIELVQHLRQILAEWVAVREVAFF